MIDFDIVVRFPHHTPVVWKEISPRNTCLLTIVHDYMFQSLFKTLILFFLSTTPCGDLKTYRHFVVNIRFISLFLYTLQAVSAKLSFKLDINVFT